MCAMSDRFDRVTRSTLADELAERIAHLVNSGEYAAGDRLPPIMEMARMFGVGHPTVREALKKLEMIGLIDIRHGSGVYVRGGGDMLLVGNPIYAGLASKKLLADLIDARMALEITAVRLAASEANDEHLERMAGFMREAAAALGIDDVALSAANMAFHREIAAASGNTVIAQLQEVLTSLFTREQSVILSIHDFREKDHSEHLAILGALRDRDADRAELLMQEHLEGVRDVIMKWDGKTSSLK